MFLDENFYGSATVGERGQVVIPAEARKQLDINPGDKVLVLKHPHAQVIALFKIGAMSEMFAAMLEDITRLETKVAEFADEHNGD